MALRERRGLQSPRASPRAHDVGAPLRDRQRLRDDRARVRGVGRRRLLAARRAVRVRALGQQDARRLVLVRDRFGILPLHYAVVVGRRRLRVGGQGRCSRAGACEPRVRPGRARAALHDVVRRRARLGLRRRADRPCRARRFGSTRDLRSKEKRYWSIDFEAADQVGAGGPRPSRRSSSSALRTVAAAAAAGGRARRRVPERWTRLLAALRLRASRDGAGLRDVRRRLQRRPLRRDRRCERGRGAALDPTPRRALPLRRLPAGASARSSGAASRRCCAAARSRSYLLARSVQQAGMKAVVSGEGADELLRRLQHLQGGPRPALLGPRSGLVACAPCSRAVCIRTSPTARCARPTPGARSSARGLSELGRPVLLAPHPLAQQRVGSSRALRRRPRRRRRRAPSTPRSRARSRRPGGRWPPLERAQAIEIQTFMSSYLLSSCRATASRWRTASRCGTRTSTATSSTLVPPAAGLGEARRSPRQGRPATGRLADRCRPEVARAREACRTARRSRTLSGAPCRQPSPDATCSGAASVGALRAPRRQTPWRRLGARASRARPRVGEREQMALLGAVTTQLLAGSSSTSSAAATATRPTRACGDSCRASSSTNAPPRTAAMA